MNTSKDFFEIIKNPKHGYGRNLNPCIDCRILMFRKASEYMREVGASFLITGEVLGERPMSQRRDAMQLIEKESGLEGLIVRPLSAALLEPSIPERNGWIDRTQLMDIKGRSRKPQIALAKAYGINDYPCPAGGCLLTDAGFAARMKDLMRHTPDFCVNDVQLLRSGKHFRLSSAVKAVVGRDKKDNERILTLSTADDVILEALDFMGPLALVRGTVADKELELAASITARYGKGRDLDSLVVRAKKGQDETDLTVTPADEPLLASLRIGHE